MTVLTLYTRQDCHLCEEMKEALQAWQSRYGFHLQPIDVDRDAGLRHRYGARVPVLVLGQREICHYFLDEPALRACLEQAQA